MDQFLRTQLLLGKDSFDRLQRSHVMVIGLGAVGSYAVEALTRAGIGRLTLIDCDTVAVTNINRQLFALHSTVGRPKAEVARERVLDINPRCRVDARQLFAAQDTFAGIFTERPDLVVDAIDAYTPKVQLIAHCYREGIPIISSMGAALRTDPLAVRVGDLLDTHHCPLAERLRRVVRKEGVGKGVTCVFSIEPVPEGRGLQAPDPGGEDYGIVRGRQRMVLGSLPTLTGIFGLVIANQAIKTLSVSAQHGHGPVDHSS